MAFSQDKMRLRLEVITLLNKYRDDSALRQKTLSSDIKALKDLEDKETLAKILYKELLSSNENYCKKCALFILETLDEDTIFKNTCQNLLSKNIADEKKFLMVTIAKQKGIKLEEDKIEQNITSCSDIAKKSIANFLKNTNFDPEVQIDFLDFYLNIDLQERLSLLENIIKESDSATAANLFALLIKLNPEKEEYDFIENYFLNSKSAQITQALDGLEIILKNEKNKKNKNEQKIKTIQKLIKKIKFLDKSKPTQEFIENSTISNCFIGPLDGEGEFSLVLSRKKQDNTNMLALFTISTQFGITSSIGFGNIDENGIVSILKRIYCAFPPISINPVALKSIYENYKLKNTALSPAPYEAYVWEKLLSDVRAINYNFEDFLNSKLEPVEITKKRFNNILKSDFLNSWFFRYNQNPYFDKIVDTVEKEGIFSIEKIEKIMMDGILKNVSNNKNYVKNLKENLLLQSYVAKLSKRLISSGVLYSLNLKSDDLVRFILYIYKKSIYRYFINKKEALEKNESEMLFEVSKNKNINSKDIEKIIKSIEEKWKLKEE